MGSTPSILAIDNSAADLLALKKAFSHAGVANPIFAVSPGEAMDYLQGRPPYLDRMQYPIPSVILLNMDQPHSFELLTWIRDKFPSGGLPIVAMTSLDGVRKLSRAYALGANSFLTKPVNSSELKELISIFGGYWLLDRFPEEEPFEPVDAEELAL